jgi:RNA polymerase sigma-70 factor, ECF subfamily
MVGTHGSQSPGDQPGQPAGDHLRGVVYEHLRTIAQRQMSDERPGHTLTATALVHEAYLRLKPNFGEGADRVQFYRAAAHAMRCILVDHARRRHAVKRSNGRRVGVDIQSVLDLASDEHLEDALALDEAILRLDGEDSEAAEVVRLRFFAGLTGDRTAEVMGISPRQVDRAWAFARAFLRQVLREAETQ